MFDLLILGGCVYDGTGAAPQTTDIGIHDGIICAIGDLADQSAKTTIHAEGRTVTPGGYGISL